MVGLPFKIQHRLAARPEGPPVKRWDQASTEMVQRSMVSTRRKALFSGMPKASLVVRASSRISLQSRKLDGASEDETRGALKVEGIKAGIVDSEEEREDSFHLEGSAKALHVSRGERKKVRNYFQGHLSTSWRSFTLAQLR